MNNGNSRPDITKSVIIGTLCEYVRKTNKVGQHISRKDLEAAIKDQLSISSTVLRNRGIKNYSELVQMINAKLDINEHISYNPYYRSSEHKKCLSERSSNWGWVTDGTNNCRVELTKIDNFILENKNYRRGRIIKK